MSNLTPTFNNTRQTLSNSNLKQTINVKQNGHDLKLKSVKIVQTSIFTNYKIRFTRDINVLFFYFDFNYCKQLINFAFSKTTRKSIQV